jgi:hypothetical protein
MADAAVLGLFLLVVISGVFFTVLYYEKHRAIDKATHRWRLEDHPSADGLEVVVWLKRIGDIPIRVGGVAVSDPDFASKIEMTRCDGRERQVAMNSGQNWLNQ